ncbi:MAG: acetyl-CoA carboxylase biotin carboxyl carrier protein [Lachnospiraceae bacterium]
MDIQDIYSLMERFETSALNRMKLEMGEIRLTLEKGWNTAAAPADGRNAAAAVVYPAAHLAAAEEESRIKEEKKGIKAPFVGTFYLAPSPDEKPFVTPGQSVKKGDVIGIIEAMKLMNEILAPEDGVIEAILVEDGAMVEYNQTLMTVK